MSMPPDMQASNTEVKDQAEKLQNSGFKIIPLVGKAPYINAWEKGGEIITSGIDKKATGIGVLTGFEYGDGFIHALDVDCLSKVLSDDMYEYLSHLFGVRPVRYGLEPKFLMPFLLDKPLKKTTSDIYCETDTNTGELIKNQIEILGKGQQFVAFGTHPETGKLYRWENGDLLIGDLPTLTQDDLQKILDNFHLEADLLGYDIKKKPSHSPAVIETEVHEKKPTKYYQAAINNAVANIQNAVEGERNNILNASAFSMFKFVKSGLLDKAEIFNQLEAAALSVGLDAGEVDATLRSAFNSSAPLDLVNIVETFDADNVLDKSQGDLAIQLGEIHFHQNARYVDAWGSWLLWNDQRWLPDKRLTHMSLIDVFLKQQADAMVALDNSNKILGLARTMKSAPFRNSIKEIIKADQQCSVLPEVFDANLLTIGTPNGTVFLKEGVLHPPQQDHYITKATGVAPVDAEPKLWLSFLNTIFDGDTELVAFIKRVCGYALTGLTVEEKIFFCYGTGANGKSKFLETLFYVMGDYARRAPASLFLESKNEQHPTNMAGMQGARLVLGSELPSGRTWNEETLKDMTGGDTITARLMRQDYFDFSPQFTLFIAGNHQPRLKNVDESMVRRLVLIPFELTIPKEERDIELGEKLKKEGGEILNWCIQGAVEYFEYGLNLPQKAIDASATYIKNEDITGEFIEGFLTDAPGRRVRFDEVYQKYSDWMKDAGNNYIKQDSRLRKEMKGRGIKIIRSNNIYWLEDFDFYQDSIGESRRAYANRK